MIARIGIEIPDRRGVMTELGLAYVAMWLGLASVRAVADATPDVV